MRARTPGRARRGDLLHLLQEPLDEIGHLGAHAGGEDDGDRLGAQPAEGEAEHLDAAAVYQVHVVRGDQQGLPIGRGGQDGQRGRGHTRLVAVHRGPEVQRCLQGRDMDLRQVGANVLEERGQGRQRRKRDLALGLVALHPDDAEPLTERDRELQQPGLADSGFATEGDDPGTTFEGASECCAQLGAFSVTTDQHGVTVVTPSIVT